MAKRIRARGGREICEPVTNLIADYLSDQMPPGVKTEFEQHMAMCPDCVAFLNTYKKTAELAKSFLQKLNQESPAWDAGEVRDRVLQRIKTSARKR